MADAVLGARWVAGRLRSPRAIVALCLALAIAAGAALAERGASPLSAPSRTIEAVWGVVLPLTSLALANAVFDGGLASNLWGLARFGASRRRLAWSATAVVMLTVVVLTAAATSLGLVIAYRGLPGLVPDLLASLPVAVAGGAAYAGWVAFGATFGRRGGGRYVPVLMDWWLGSGVGLMALPWPRAHLQALAGGPVVLDLTPAASSACLWLLALLLWWGTGRRLAP